MNILLTGAQGQVGWELARLLPALGTVTALGRAQVDLADAAKLRAAILQVRPQLLVNAAAYTAVDQAQVETDLAMKINGDAVRVMAQTMSELGGVMLHYSTDYVFDGRAGRPYTEGDAVGPLNQYGVSKLAGEQALKASGVAHLNFRTSWIYGNRGRNFLLTILRLAREQPELRIVSDQMGSPTWCRYVARASCEILRRCFTTSAAQERLRGEWSGTYHLSAHGVTSWHGFAEEILRARNGGRLPQTPKVIAIRTAEYPVPAARPLNSLLDNGKLQRTFAIQPVPWDELLHQCVAEMP